MFSRQWTSGPTASFSDGTKEVARRIDAADAVLVGAGAGLTAACGSDFSYTGERFERLFGDMEERYGFHDMYSGGFYPYDTPEEMWAFWARYVWHNRYACPVGEAYQDLLEIVGGRDYFVLTTNVDHQFQRAGFDRSRLFYTQGDYGLWQCSVPCHDRTYDNYEVVRQMVERERDMRVPTELVPTCPVCGEPMGMNLRSDDTFVEDAGWHRASDRYGDFLRRHRGLRVVLLEVGVGGNTPGIVKYPFWQMAAQNDRAFYVQLNLGEVLAPSAIADRSVLLDGDAAEALAAIRGELAA